MKTTTSHHKSSDSSPPTEKIGEEIVNKKYSRFIQSWRLLLAIKNSDGKIVLPQLSKQFVQCFSSSKTENVRTFKGFMKDWMRDRSHNNRDYFIKNISKLLMNHATCTMLLQCSFHLTSLDDDKAELDHSISMLNFLPVSQESSEYQSYCATTRGEELDEVMEECPEKKVKKNTKTFCKGMQDSVGHVLTAMANLDAILAFVVSCDQKEEYQTPMLVWYIRRFADIIISPDFQSFERKFLPDCPWIPHNLLCMIQQLLAEAASVADNTANINLVIEKNQVPTSLYDRLFLVYETNIKNMTMCCTMNHPGVFQLAARSFTNKNPKNFNNQKRKPGEAEDASNDKSPSKQNLSKRGWFVSTARFSWPQTLSIRPCIKFGQQGLSCRNPNCTFDHKIFPQHFSETDKKNMIQFEKNTDGFSFTQYVVNRLKNESSVAPPAPTTTPDSQPEIKKPKVDKNDKPAKKPEATTDSGK